LKNNKDKNIDLPEVYKHYAFMENTKSKGDYLLKLQNGHTLINQYYSEKGCIFVFGIPLNTGFSNITKHALFVPTIYKTVIYNSKYSPISYTVGDNDIIQFKNSSSVTDGIYTIKAASSNFEFIPEFRNTNGQFQLLEHGQIKTADNYFILMNKDTIDAFSFNYNRAESNLNCYTNEELKNTLESNGFKYFSVVQSEQKKSDEALTEMNQGKKLWKICITLALLFLALEALLLRYINVNKVI
jgi:hypothetical protein